MELPMFICRQMPSETNPNGDRTVYEVTPEVLSLFLDFTAKAGSQASKDAALISLCIGSEIRGTGSSLWYRVAKPLTYVPTPTKCDISQRELGDVMYDGKVNGCNGQWAIMDEQSWTHYGCGRIGTGFAQKYLRGSDGQFYGSEGMASVRRLKAQHAHITSPS